MRRILTILTCFLFASRSFSQGPANLEAYTFDYSTFTFYNGAALNMEVPPWQIAGGWHTYFFSDGSNTNTYSDPQDMVSSTSIWVSGHGPYLATGPYGPQMWKRSYQEIYSAHSLQHPSEGLINIGICHAENKDWCGSHNTINPARPYNYDIPCGQNDWDAYYGILNAVWTPSNASNNWGQQGYHNELGPILWPSNGYVNANNECATNGLRHPSSIISGDYMYVFIVDSGPNHVAPEEGREGGVKLVRVHVNNILNPSAYEVYYKDPSGNEYWLPSLPSGFTKENMINYVKTQGSKSTSILPTYNTSDQRFSVAYVNGTNYFIGVEEYQEWNGTHAVAIRFSYDLKNWTDRRGIIESSDNQGESDVTYPIFLSADGWSNTAVDLNDFYVIATAAEGRSRTLVTRAHIYLTPPFFAKTNAEARKVTTSNSGAIDNSKVRPPIVTPNPGPGLYKLNYTLKTPAKTQVRVLNLMGKLVQVTAARNQKAGTYTESIDISSYAKGIYLLELLVNGKKQTFKVIYQ